MKIRQNKKTHFVLNLNIFKLLSILLIILFILFTPLLIKTSVKIKKVECSSQIGKCPTEIEKFLNNFIGLNYQVVKKNLSNYLDNNFLVSDYLLQYKIPNTVKLDLNVKKYTNSFVFKGDTQFFHITDEGQIVDIKDKTDVPNIVVNDFKLSKNLKAGEIVDSKIIFAASIVNNLNYLFSIKEVNLEQNYISCISNEGISIILPSVGDKDLIIGSLRLIFSRLNKAGEGIRMEDVREIDLRYKNPILRRK